MASDKTTANLPAVPDYSKYAAQGFDHAPPPAVPRLKIISANMKDFGKEGTPLEKAVPGEMWITEKNIIAKAFSVIPVNMMRSWKEWETKKPSGSPPLAVYSARPATARWVKDEGLKMPTGTFIFEDREYFVVVKHDATNISRCIMTFSRTSLSVEEMWRKRLQTPIINPQTKHPYVPPIFARLWSVTTERVEKGENHWHTFKIGDNPAWLEPGKDMFQRAQEFLRESGEYIDQMTLVDPQARAKTVDSDDIPF